MFLMINGSRNAITFELLYLLFKISKSYFLKKKIENYTFFLKKIMLFFDKKIFYSITLCDLFEGVLHNKSRVIFAVNFPKIHFSYSVTHSFTQ